jgi:hypothetical protein
MKFLKLWIRYQNRKRFLKALEKADWRNAIIITGGDKAVDELRPLLRIEPPNRSYKVEELRKVADISRPTN